MGPIFFFQWSPYPHDKDEVCMLTWLIDFGVYALTLCSPHIHTYTYTRVMLLLYRLVSLPHNDAQCNMPMSVGVAQSRVILL